ncbi:hypothetical protein I6A81_37900 [Frankia sp. CN7]|uniref:Uncharacterized protein n=1 Tax=Frankia nepalensis TaxID=1836974 RepID=A0A937RH04_9ACTN|nr:hypothetical protein [Frankia nepalensis]MBL7501934.1 hypothetical protein [Frankia nepalensis]MBL7628810.1 hypothetical protein [Frankia nepalensis]
MRLWQYSGADVTYNQGWFVSFGSPLTLGASLLGSALYNSHQRQKAAAMAAEQWRLTAQGHLFLTNHRIGLSLSSGWWDIDFRQIRSSGVDGTGIILMLSNQAPMRLEVWPPHWFFVLLRFLAYGEIIRVEIPPHLRRTPPVPPPARPALPPGGTTGDYPTGGPYGDTTGGHPGGGFQGHDWSARP